MEIRKNIFVYIRKYVWRAKSDSPSPQIEKFDDMWCSASPAYVLGRLDISLFGTNVRQMPLKSHFDLGSEL